MFAIIADEARDANHPEQLSFCVRYLKSGMVQERFLTFVHVHDLSAAGLATALKQQLRNEGINLSHCVAQCYDGASVMSGAYNGVQAVFRCSAAMFTAMHTGLTLYLLTRVKL